MKTKFHPKMKALHNLAYEIGDLGLDSEAYKQISRHLFDALQTAEDYGLVEFKEEEEE